MTTNLTEAVVEAGARAILAGADIGSFYASGDWDAAGADVQMSMHKAAAVALTAALPILHPTIPNTVEALEELPEGSIIRHDEGLLWVRIAEHLWADGPHEPAVTTQRVTLSAPTGTAWTVLWPLGGAA